MCLTGRAPVAPAGCEQVLLRVSVCTRARFELATVLFVNCIIKLHKVYLYELLVYIEFKDMIGSVFMAFLIFETLPNQRR